MRLSSPPAASIVIATKNRRNELRTAVRSALLQTAPVEVLVLDDGSTDGTAEMIHTEFPTVRVDRTETSRGYIAQRNRAARLAKSDIIFSLDDDAAFTTPRVVAQTLVEFSDARVGAVAIPYRDVNRDQILRQVAPERQGIWVTDRYIGTAHAVRRDVFLQLGGYREYLMHQGEEGDFCLRLLAAGYVVRLGNADPILHFESPRRDFRRMDFFGRRNDILFAWHNVPLPYLTLHLVATTGKGVLSMFRYRRFFHSLRGLVYGYIDSIRDWSARRPVPSVSYKLHRHLKTDGPARLADIAHLLP